MGRKCGLRGPPCCTACEQGDLGKGGRLSEPQFPHLPLAPHLVLMTLIRMRDHVLKVSPQGLAWSRHPQTVKGVKGGFSYNSYTLMSTYTTCQGNAGRNKVLSALELLLRS